ncbi:MAG: ATP-binding protein [Rhodanobacter sp.]
MAGLLNAESVWSKAEKQATIELDRYAEFGGHGSLDRFRSEIAILDDDRIARDMVWSDHYDNKQVYKLFASGEVLPSAIPSCVFALRYLHDVSFLHDAFTAWKDTDSAVIELSAIASRLKSERDAGPISTGEEAAARERIYELNSHMAPKTKVFSRAIAIGASWFTNALFWLIVIVSLLALFTWLIMADRIFRGIRDTEDRYQKLFDGAPDAMIIVDVGSDEILDANRVARDWTGANVVGRRFASLFTDERFSYTQNLSSNALLTFDGSSMPVETQTSVIAWGKRKVRQALVRNISDRVAMERERRVAAVMGHEMRNPLNAIINASRLLGEAATDKTFVGLTRFIASAASVLKSQGAPDGQGVLLEAIAQAATRLLNKHADADEERSLLSMMVSNSQLLLSRLNDVIDMVAINNGKLSFHDAPFSLGRLMGLISDETQPQAKAKFQKLLLVADADQTVVLLGDSRRIQQSVTNIIFNAIKYSPEHSTIEVHLVATNHDDSSVSLEFRITDSGTGIPDAKKGQIFEPFYQARKTDSQIYDGLGIGLFLVKTVSDAIGGNLRVEDRLGGGTVFIWKFTLPRAALSDSSVADIPLSSYLFLHKERVTSLHCLIADDTPSNRAVLHHALMRAGHTFTEVCDGGAALAAMQKERFDVILLDMHMPTMSGEELLARMSAPGLLLRDHPEIIVISADTTVNRQAGSLFEAATAVLAKPIIMEDLMDLLEAVSMRRYGRRRRGDAPDHAPQKTPRNERVKTTHVEWMLEAIEPETVGVFLRACGDGIRSNAAVIEGALLLRSDEKLRFAIHSLKNEFQNIDYIEGVAWCAFATAEGYSDLSAMEFRSSLRGHVVRAMSRIERLESVALSS